MIQKFEEHTQEEQANTIAHYLPSGKFWSAKWKITSNLRKLLLGLGLELLRIENKYNEFFNEYIDIENTTYYISEREKQLGIPDGCITVADNLEDRRNNILLKLASIGASTEQDFIDIAAILGVTITVTNLLNISKWPWTWPHTWGGTDKENRFTMVVTFVGTTLPSSWPWTWPHTWSLDTTDVLRCLFTKLKPADTNISFRFQ